MTLSQPQQLLPSSEQLLNLCDSQGLLIKKAILLCTPDLLAWFTAGDE